MNNHIFIAVAIAMITFACGQKTQEGSSYESKLVSIESKSPAPSLDKEYWYSGKAELARYSLDQFRYGAIHPGEVISIFVTEDFLTDKQVKNDTYTNDNSVSVLKLNDVRRFTTGIYDYSMMTSVFTRADGSATEKVTLSSQDWCGQTFVQLNREDDEYRIELRSYFEKEGDATFNIKADLLEDEIRNLIRIDPDRIPEGKIDVLPSLTSLRFSHDTHQAQSATITKGTYGGSKFVGAGLKQIELNYDKTGRRVIYVYDPADHNKIAGWSEEKNGSRASQRTTASITDALHLPYWQLNSPNDTDLRAELGL